MRIATWNLKQAVGPRKKVTELMGWADSNIGADVYAFTEAKVPEDLDPRWQCQWNPEGVYPDKPNKWGTVLASNRLTLNPIVSVGSKFRSKDLQFKWPAAVQVADVIKDGEVWCTLVGLYAVTRGRTNDDDRGNGSYSLPKLLSQLEPLFNSPRGDRVIVAGDFNIWPDYVVDSFRDIGLTSVTDIRKTFPTLRDPQYGSRIWTHKNGAKTSDGMRQELDFMFISKDLKKKFVSTKGGVGDYPDAWEMSDHAPVSVDLSL